jgi:hypothetical protein
MIAIDRRLLDAGITATMGLLLDVWADHCPAHTPVPETCPGCGHNYITDGPLCPTARVLRPLIWRRRRETSPDAFLIVLTFNQYEDLFGKHLSTETASLGNRARYRANQPASADPTPGVQDGLFNPAQGRRRPGGTR